MEKIEIEIAIAEHNSNGESNNQFDLTGPTHPYLNPNHANSAEKRCSVTNINEVSSAQKPPNEVHQIPHCKMDNGVAEIKTPQGKGIESVPSSQVTFTPLDCDDWTDGLPATAHVRFFKSTNWAATALGPLKDWNLALRLHTHSIFADSRSACLYWYVPHVCEG